MHFSAKLATFIETRKLLGTYHHTEKSYDKKGKEEVR